MDGQKMFPILRHRKITLFFFPLLFLLLASHTSSFTGVIRNRIHYSIHQPFQKTILTPFRVASSRNLPKLPLFVEDDNELESLRDEIESLRNEARARIESLSARMPIVSSSMTKEQSFVAHSSVTPTHRREEAINEAEAENEAVLNNQYRRYERERAIAVKDATRKKIDNEIPDQTVPSLISDQDLLEDTHWRLMLNIGREPGTWMPKTWGASGQRLLLNLEVEFTSKQLSTPDDFFTSSRGRSRVLRITPPTVTLGPTLKEGSRTYSVSKCGGWAIGKGQGPMGTDILRFFFELDQDVFHYDGDVDIPKGKVYCTCGYFPLNKGLGEKLELRRSKDDLELEYYNLKDEIDVEGLFSMKKVKLMKDLYRVENKLNDVTKRLNEAKVRHPERSSMSLSRKGDLGLTKGGGVCCAVESGSGKEYHILGKFGVASVEPKRDRLMP